MEENKGIKNYKKMEKEESENYYIPKYGTLCVYGGFGSGKTYTLCEMGIEALNEGAFVYSSFPIKWEGVYEENNIFKLIMGLIGIKNKFIYYPKENLKIFDMYDPSFNFVEFFKNKTNAVILVDEAYKPFNSYELGKISGDKMDSILLCRHFDKAIWYATQRPMNVHTVLRENTEMFVKCEKIGGIINNIFGALFAGGMPKIRRTFTDLDFDGKPNLIEPISVQEKRINYNIAKQYNSKYARKGMKNSQETTLMEKKFTKKEIAKKIIEKIKKIFDK